MTYCNKCGKRTERENVPLCLDCYRKETKTPLYTQGPAKIENKTETEKPLIKFLKRDTKLKMGVLMAIMLGMFILGYYAAVK